MIIFFVDQNYKNKTLTKILDLKKIEAVNRPIEAANGLPNECYINKDYLAYEKEKIFCNKWTVVGVGSSIPNPGDAKPYNLLGIPLILIRDKEMKIRVFHNVCPHRGHILVSEAGRMKKMLRCPYHSWTFQLDGKLAKTPHIGGVGVRELEHFDPSCHGMRQIRSEVWNDLIFINLDGEAEPFSQFIQPLEKRWKNFWGLSVIRRPLYRFYTNF